MEDGRLRFMLKTINDSLLAAHIQGFVVFLLLLGLFTWLVSKGVLP